MVPKGGNFVPRPIDVVIPWSVNEMDRLQASSSKGVPGGEIAKNAAACRCRMADLGVDGLSIRVFKTCFGVLVNAFSGLERVHNLRLIIPTLDLARGHHRDTRKDMAERRLLLRRESMSSLTSRNDASARCCDRHAR